VGIEVKMRGLSEAEVHLIRAQVALASPHLGGLLEEASNEVKEALAADPTLVGALQLVAPHVPPQTRLEDGRRAVAAHPNDGWAWLLLADGLWDAQGPPEERLRAYQRAVELLPDSALILARAARNYLSRNERLEALRLAERAAQLAPGNGEVLAIDALALAAAGRCAEGISLANQARAILPAGNVGLTKALDIGLERACVKTTPADAGA
jgi:tetratricopeptide (TPR) repeat protein